MNGNNLSNGVYTDFRGLTELRYNAATHNSKALDEVGKHFEAMFIQMMLQSMRQATPGDSLFGGKEQELYRDLFDKQISLNMAAKSTLGLADLIVSQLQHKIHSQISSESGSQQSIPQTSPVVVEGNKYSPRIINNLQDNGISAPKEFVKNIWPYAQQAAKQLEIDPQVLVAQAALETGWGRGIARHLDGRSSNNLFGIKAGSGWQGETVSVVTLEYRDGIPVRERTPFRSYNSPADSFQDYVNYLQNNPRYKEALMTTNNPTQFVSSLQDAGYATDPAYADKILGVLNGDTLTSALADLKLTGVDPIG